MEPSDLAENGHEVREWRLVHGRPELVAVAIGVTIPGLDGEDFEHF